MRRSTAEFLALGDVESVLAFHRATFGDARAEDAPGAPGDGGAGGDGQGTPAGAGRTFTQADVDAISARKEREAEQKATRALAERLGVDPDKIDDAATQLQAARDAEAARLSEAEKRERAAADREQKATDRETAAAGRERDALVRAALAEAGCARADITDARRLVDLPDGDVDEAAITEAVDKLKERRGELFKGTATVTPPPSSTPPHAPRPPAPSNTMAAAREKAREQVVALGLADVPKSA